MPELTTYDVSEGVAVLRLDRPKSRNAMNTQMLEEMLGHIASAREDDEARALVVSSTDHLGLSAGADVREELDEEGRIRRMQLFADLYDDLVSSRSRPLPSATAPAWAVGRRLPSPATSASAVRTCASASPAPRLAYRSAPHAS